MCHFSMAWPTLTLCSIMVLFPLSSLSQTQDCQPPQVTLFHLDENATAIGDGNTTLMFTGLPKISPRFLLQCEHNTPVRWVFDQDFTKGYTEPSRFSGTTRSFQDFNDPSTYKFGAKYFLDLQQQSNETVFICMSFTDTTSKCSRAVVLGRREGKESYSLQVLSNERLLRQVPLSLLKFYRDFEKLPGPQQAINVGNGSCTFGLTMGLEPSRLDLGFKWNETRGSENIQIMYSAQSLANSFLFYPQMEEDCITVYWTEAEIAQCCASSILSLNDQQNIEGYKSFPLVLTYVLGNQRRVLKIFFDLAQKRSFYYSWEAPNLPLMSFGYSQAVKVYQGQEFLYNCFSSVATFSRGTQIGWAFEHHYSGDSSLDGSKFSGLASNPLEIDQPTYGTFQVQANLSFTRDFLIKHNLSSVRVICMSPLWNSKEWVNWTEEVQLLWSEPPTIQELDIDESAVADTENITVYEITDMTKENFSISCEASGTPVPEVVFIHPRNNSDIETSVRISENGTKVVTLFFPTVTLEHEGLYICQAKNFLNESQRKYLITFPKALLPRFVVIILIIGGVLIFVFALAGSALLIKLKREKIHFMKATEAAITKFQEGFQNSQDLGFKANSEYKHYEIPLSRWGVGNTMLGSGAYGVVQKGVIYYGENKQDVVAVKTVNSPKDVEDFENSLMELTIMSYIGKHEHVVSLIAACTDNISKRSIMIGVEFCANGDLQNYMKKRKALFSSFVRNDGKLTLESITGRGSYANVANSGNFNTLDLYRWSYQIASGMDYLASKKILHGDLAARNVLLTADKTAKVSDFGLSRSLIMSDNYTKKTNQPLPWKWMALESLKYRQFSVASDVWSYGVTLYEIFMLGDDPWQGMQWTNEFMETLENGRRLARPKFATSNMYDKIMLETWRNEPADRITFTEAKEFFETAITNLTSPEGKDDEFLNSVC